MAILRYADERKIHRTLQTVTAVIELGAGLALLCFPSTTVVLLHGSSLDTPAALTVARVGVPGCFRRVSDAGLREVTPQGRAARGLVAAMLLYDVAAVAILAFAGVGFGVKSVGLWPAVVLHAVMIVRCVTYLLRSSLNARGTVPCGTIQTSRNAAINSRLLKRPNANNRHLGPDAVFNRHDKTPTVDVRARDHGRSVPRI
jgi:hypothetical protein